MKQQISYQMGDGHIVKQNFAKRIALMQYLSIFSAPEIEELSCAQTEEVAN